MCNKSSYFRQHILSLSIIFYLILSSTSLHAGNADLFETYEQIKTELEQNTHGIPVYIQSDSENNTMHGQVYGILDHPFITVRQGLVTPDKWCDIVSQHLNIKACTYQHVNGYCELTFYTGRKHYEPANEVYQIPYRYKNIVNKQDFFQASLTSAKGPMGTKNYLIEVEAIPLDASRTFIRFSYSYNYNFLTKIGMKTYLATLGHGKVGFSRIGVNKQDQPIYVSGVRGIIERNAIRYFFAIQSYLYSYDINIAERFNVRINKWFDLTERHHFQLYEMERTDYLKYKKLEHENQMQLQHDINSQNNTTQKC